MMPNLLRNRWVHLGALLLLCFLVYCPAVRAPFYLDDRHVVVENKEIRSLPGLVEAATHGAQGPGHGTVSKTRIVGMLTFALDYRAHGLDPAGYHAVNISIHTANVLLLYCIVLLVFRTPAAQDRDRTAAHAAAAFAALVFAVHPLQTQAVTYVSQRFASLATFFCFCSLVLYLLARRAARPAAALALLSCATAFSAFAMFTKEMSFTFPLIIVLLEFIFFRGAAGRRLLFLVPLILTMLIIPAVMLGASSGSSATVNLDSATRASAAGISRLEYALTQPRVILTYLRLFLFPINQNLDYDYPLIRDAGWPLTVPAFLVLAGLFALAAALLFRVPSRGPLSALTSRLLSFGILWFFLALAVESSVIPIDDLIFEHRMYYPMAGIALSCAALAAALLQTGFTRIVLPGVFVWVLLLSLAAFSRNMLWADQVPFSEDLALKSPNKARPYLNLGYAYEQAGLLEKAAGAYEKSLDIKSNDALARYNLGNIYFKQSRFDDAVRQYQIVIALDPDFAEAHNNLGNTFLQLGRYEDAAREFRTALIFDPGFSKARFNLDFADRVLSGMEKNKAGR